jgi:hypothetical protein
LKCICMVDTQEENFSFATIFPNDILFCKNSFVNNNYLNLHWLDSKKSNNFILFFNQFLV